MSSTIAGKYRRHTVNVGNAEFAGILRTKGCVGNIVTSATVGSKSSVIRDRRGRVNALVNQDRIIHVDVLKVLKSLHVPALVYARLKPTEGKKRTMFLT